jgi:hypothetical protein
VFWDMTPYLFVVTDVLEDFTDHIFKVVFFSDDPEM